MSIAGPSRALRLLPIMRCAAPLPAPLRAPLRASRPLGASLGLGLDPLPFPRAFSTTTARFPRVRGNGEQSALSWEPIEGTRGNGEQSAVSLRQAIEAQDLAQRVRERERERKESRWNQYGRREPVKSWWRPIVFTLGFSIFVYHAAAVWTNNDALEWCDKLRGPLGFFRRLPSEAQLNNVKRKEDAESAQQTIKELPRVLSFLPSYILVPVIRTYIMFKERQLNASEAHLSQAKILGVLGTVFICWKLKSFQPFMTRWFLHNPVAWTKRQDWRNSFTMFTSTFSHKDFAHLAFNSIALYSFGSAAYYYLATPVPNTPALPTRTHTAHFFAFFAVAGVFAGLGSHLASNLVRLPRLIRALRSPAQLSPTHALTAHQGLSPSLGASGAIYACVTMTALAFPDADVSLIFLPMIAIPMPIGVLGMVAVDVVGIVRGWRVFDHFAHLSGALFGVLYYFKGREYWNRFRLSHFKAKKAMMKERAKLPKS